MDEPKSLKTVFKEAEANRLALDGASSISSPSFLDDLSNAIHGYELCLQLVDRLSIFSPNESAEDISTSDIPYLLLSYHIAELVQKQSTSSPDARRRILDTARRAYERFLRLLDSYSLLSPTYAKLLERYADDPASFSTVSSADPASRRNAKIANFRAEKELRQRLEILRRRQEPLGDGEEDGAGGPDDEAVRELHLANVNFCAHMAFQGLESLNREAEILAQAPQPLLPQETPPAVEEDARRRHGEADGDFSERLEPVRLQSAVGRGGPLLTKEGRPLQPFTLLGNRQEIQKGVFRPGHNLPTMTIDEYLEEERRRGGIIEGGGEASWQRPEPDEDNIEKADEETMKARAWDEFTEANPKGSGNTLNRG
ncbi:TAP42-like family protein [Pleurostoma richardsiae]|uniref:TAP42-like family protein n=1 Tax=Pleurostoma richardsiae TaxID=41990 RepID=A0AA38VLP4_9PEZI|nr:TAP42-like family protein [Pleurostoma richardsiae]